MDAQTYLQYVEHPSQVQRSHVALRLRSRNLVRNSGLDSKYNTELSAIERGVIAVGNMTQAGTMMKFSWMLAQMEQAIEDGLLARADTAMHVTEQ